MDGVLTAKRVSPLHHLLPHISPSPKCSDSLPFHTDAPELSLVIYMHTYLPFKYTLNFRNLHGVIYTHTVVQFAFCTSITGNLPVADSLRMATEQSHPQRERTTAHAASPLLIAHVTTSVLAALTMNTYPCVHLPCVTSY